ncbi:MAG: DUF503 domain-containing protein [Terriglobales bacterium]
MSVAILQLEIHLPDSHSLKDRRQVLRSLKDRLRQRFNVAVAELNPSDLWQRATIGIAAIGEDHAYVEGLLRQVGDAAVDLLHGQSVHLGEIEFLD